MFEATVVIEQIHAHIAADLRVETPAFTKLLAPGLGLAENPREDTALAWTAVGS